MTSDYDIVIVGGGMVGLLLAKLIAPLNLSIAIVDSSIPDAEPSEIELLRVSAISRASQNVLSQIGCWNDRLLEGACAYDSMKVWDDVAGGEIYFHAADLGEPDIGHIVPNCDIRRTLWQELENEANVHLLAPVTLEQAIWSSDHVTLTTHDGHTIRGQLAIAADGANSWLRQQSLLHIDQFSYEHYALVTTINCEKPHNRCARQAFLDTGPLALLPLPDPNQCSIVWSTEPNIAESLRGLQEQQFNEELQTAFGTELGTLEVTHNRITFPLISRHVSEYVTDRLALVGDAAHTIHPLAGQGVNLGFMDAASLAQVISDNISNNRSFYHKSSLRAYERWRRSENQLMLDAMLGIKTIFSKQPQPLNRIRSWGMNVINQSAFLKRHMTNIAMGISGDLPRVARTLKPDI